MRYTLLYYIGVLLLLFGLITACDTQTVYVHYEHTPVTGWERNDTLRFQIGALSQTADYAEEVGLRINSDYPFTMLQLIFEQELLPSHQVRIDTLDCTLVDQRGNMLGQGVINYQYRFPLATLPLEEGDRLQIVVRHNMKREILPGISDVGIRLTRQH